MKQKTNTTWTDKVAHKLASGLLAMQRNYSNRVNVFFSLLSPQQLRILLFVFCISGGGFSLYLVGKAVWGNRSVIHSITVDPVKVPAYSTRPGDEMNATNSPQEMLLDIQRYKAYLDSCGETLSPGMRDSIQVLEQYYLQQK